MDVTLNSLLDGAHRLANAVDPSSVAITGLTSDSREVKKNYLFFAQSGTHRDGHTYIRHAIGQGASAVVSDQPYDAGLAGQYPYVALISSRDVRESMALMSARFYKTDLSRMIVIGITGTNGKSTIAHFLNRIIRSFGFKTVLMGTIGIEIAGATVPTDYTTPPAYEIHRYLRMGADAGATWVIMEVSSHALKLKRVAGLTFDRAVFTNLTPEHGEIHPSMEDYYQTKSALFRMLKSTGAGIINADDPYGQRLIHDHGNCIKVYDYGFQAKTNRMVEIRIDENGMYQEIGAMLFGNSYGLRIKMPGRYNAYNALAALTALSGYGFDSDRLLQLFREIGSPEGRFQRYSADGIQVVIDFAHTPDGLEQVLLAIRPLMKTGQRLIVLFGCPGDRDKTKRPVMGRIASRHADLSVITSDDPHFEDPDSVILDIIAEMETGKFRRITDRREAIRFALSEAAKGDWILIAGRGHEKFQYIGDTKEPFYDEEVFFNEAVKLGMKVVCS